MTDQLNDDRVGYARPPKHTKRKKRQGGTSRKKKRQPRPSESVIAMIDRLLDAPVKITKNGTPTIMTALEAIVHQLLQKSLSGNKKANRALLEFQDFARLHEAGGQIEIVFVDNEYTRALSASRPESDDV